MLKIWGRANSINVQKVLWCCQEVGLDYERIDAGLHFGVNDTPEYAAMNPTGLVPTIEDGDVRLWESNVIVRYLAAKFSRTSIRWADSAPPTLRRGSTRRDGWTGRRRSSGRC